MNDWEAYVEYEKEVKVSEKDFDLEINLNIRKMKEIPWWIKLLREERFYPPTYTMKWSCFHWHDVISNAMMAYCLGYERGTIDMVNAVADIAERKINKVGNELFDDFFNLLQKEK